MKSGVSDSDTPDFLLPRSGRDFPVIPRAEVTGL